MIGHQSVTAFIYALGLIPLFISIVGPSHIFVKIMLIASIIMTLSAVGWILYVVSYNRVSPLINRIRPEEEIVWLRVTKNNTFSPQIVKKGVYGQTKGIIHRKKADVIDKGDFTINLINGNKAIIVHDMMSHNVNLKNAIAWQQIFKENNVGSGDEAYQLATTKKPKKKIRFTKHPKKKEVGKDE